MNRKMNFTTKNDFDDVVDAVDCSVITLHALFNSRGTYFLNNVTPLYSIQYISSDALMYC